MFCNLMTDMTACPIHITKEYVGVNYSAPEHVITHQIRMMTVTKTCCLKLVLNWSYRLYLTKQYMVNK